MAGQWRAGPGPMAPLGSAAGTIGRAMEREACIMGEFGGVGRTQVPAGEECGEIPLAVGGRERRGVRVLHPALRAGEVVAEARPRDHLPGREAG